jgi:hypothetical protein
MNYACALFIVGLTALSYYCANLVGAELMSIVVGQSCTSSVWFVRCHLPDDVSSSPVANTALGLIAFASILALRTFGRNLSVYPFGLLICSITIFVVGVDAVAQRGILYHDRIVNDTMNALSIVLLGSFLVITSIASFRDLPVIRLSLAIVWSYLVKVVGMLIFGILQWSFRGPVELWLLYGIFTWMVFGLHLMSVSLALVGVDNSSRTPGVRT